MIDHSNPPKPINPITVPAYRDGWADIANEAAELGIKGFEKSFSGPDYFLPIPHCVRLHVADPFVMEWLRTSAAISAHLRRPPSDPPPWWERIMLTLHRAVLAYRQGVSNG